MSSSLYRSFKRALAYIATQLSPGDDEVLDFVALRSAVLAELGLPASRHNIDRLMMCGIAGLSLERFLQAVEIAIPQGVVGNCFENQPPVSASRSAVNASMRS